MYYNLVKTPPLIKTGNNILSNIDELLASSHLIFPNKILITQRNLYEIYGSNFEKTEFLKILFIEGGNKEEALSIIKEIKNRDAILIAFGGGSVLDIVKYAATRVDKPYITIPSTLSNDAIYSSVSRLTVDGKKVSFGVDPPIGIIVDIEIIKNSPKKLILAGVADLVSNLSAIDDWLLSHKETGEQINELAYLLAKEAAFPILRYEESQIFTDSFLYDLTNGLLTSGLSMIIAGNTRGISGSEHLISHAIDEFFPEKSTIHGLQVGWAHQIIDREYRKKTMIINFFKKIGLDKVIADTIPFSDSDIKKLIPYTKHIRNRYTILNSKKLV